MKGPIDDQKAILKLANIVSLYANDVDRGEALLERRAEVMEIYSRYELGLKPEDHTEITLST